MTGSPPLNQDVAREQQLIGSLMNTVLDRFLDTVGDETGTTAMNTVPDEFLITPGAGYIYVIDKLKILIADTAGMLSIAGFGNGEALTNGFKLELRRGTNVEKTFFDAVKTNPEMISLGDEKMSRSDTLLTVTIHWPVPIRVPYGYSLVFQTLDSMVTMEYMKVRIKGRSFKV